MEKVIIASMRKSAGKTSTIVGITAAAKKKIAYAKPFGERMLYRKKRLWDYDSSLISALFGLKEDPVDMSIGFDHSKLRYMYDEEGTRKKLMENIGNVADDRDVLFIEGGRDLTYGISVHLDTLSLAKYTGGKLFIVVSGDDDSILDDLLFLKRHVNLAGVNLNGVIINKVQNLEEFQSTHLPAIRQMDIQVMGVIPYQSELTHFTVSYLSERLFAKVLCGDGGDRTDMILASLESDTSGIILTNNILPPSNIISKASERNIPLLMVFSDTYQTAKQIESLEPLLTKDDGDKVEMLKTLFQKHVNVQEILGK
jgi:BioD-like phosphotransacetylase family protein